MAEEVQVHEKVFQIQNLTSAVVVLVLKLRGLPLLLLLIGYNSYHICMW